MKFYYDGVLICGAKTQKYRYAIVYPSSQERWVMHSRHCSLASAQTMFERIKRGMSFYDPEKAASLRVVPLEMREE